MLKTAFAAAALTATTALSAGPALACDQGGSAPERASDAVTEQSTDHPGPLSHPARSLTEPAAERAAELTGLTGLGARTPLAAGEATEGERAGADQLTITVEEGDERSGATTFTLDCRPAGGTHSDPAAACDELVAVSEAGATPFDPVPQDTMCTQIDGGPASARVTGEWQGEQVDATFSRSNGCEMNRWDSVATVLGG